MAKKKTEVTVGGSRFIITQLGAVEGRGLYKKFVATVGPLLREVLSGTSFAKLQTTFEELGGEDETKKAAAGMTALSLLAPLMIRALEEMPAPFFEELCDVFSRNCVVMIGNPIMPIPLDTASVFDSHFAGDYTSLTAWLIQCIKFNGFLGKLGSAESGAPATQ